MDSPQASGQPPPPSDPGIVPQQQPAHVSGLAIGSLVSLVTCIPLLPIILGIAALRKIKHSVGRLKGEGIAITAIVLGGVQVVFGIPMVAGLLTPLILHSRKQADRAKTTSYMRCLGLALFSFEEEYGSYPSWQIYEENRNHFPNVTRGDSSNDLLGLLVAGGFTDSEVIFYARGGSPIHMKPDNVFDTPSTLLEPGECGFGYVMLQGGRAMSNATNHGGCPLLVTPLMPGSGGADPEFNKKPYDGMAVYLRLDQAAKQARINENGKVVLPDRRTLFETGLDTVWRKDIPDVRPPE